MSDVVASPPRLIVCRLCGGEIEPFVVARAATGPRSLHVVAWRHRLSGKEACP